MKDELCKAFCDDLTVRDVPDGLAVGTGFLREDGDAIGFYVVRHASSLGLYRLEDDGATVSYLEACGVDFTTDTRARAFNELLAEYGAGYDLEEATIHSAFLTEQDLPKAAIKFVALMLRVPDFLLLTQERVASTFRDDAVKHIKSRLSTRARIVENEPVSPTLTEVTPDMVLTAQGRTPVALFFGTSAQRVNDAVFLQMAAMYEAEMELSVVALLESDTAITQELRRRASNRLGVVPVYRGDETAAIGRIEREVLGDRPTVH